MNEREAFSVDSPSVSEAHEEHEDSFGGGLLAARIRGEDSSFEPSPVSIARPAGVEDVTLGAATQIETDSGQVRFLVPFAGRWPSEHWLRAFRQSQLSWPPQLVEPLLDEGRGLQLGPLPAAGLEDHVRSLKDRISAANRIYSEEIEPDLRRQREDAIRREQEAHRLQAEVEAKLKYLLG